MRAGERIISAEEFTDEIEQAEAIAREIAVAQDGGRFPCVGVGGRGIAQVFLLKLQEMKDRHTNDIERLNARVNALAIQRGAIPLESRPAHIDPRFEPE